jgi:hypothetical protein
VNRSNTDLLQRIEGREKVFLSLDTIVEKDQAVALPTEF